MRNPELPAGGGILFSILLKASVVGGIFFRDFSLLEFAWLSETGKEGNQTRRERMRV